LWPSIVTLFCVLFASTYRTFDTGLVFGVDVLFSILISNAYGFSLLSISFIVRDSLYSLVKGEEWSSSSVERLMERYIRMSKLWILYDAFFAQLGWLTCFTDEIASLNMLRCILIAYSVQTLVLCCFGQNFSSKYKATLEAVAKFKGNISELEDLVQFPDLVAWMERRLRKLRRIQHVLIPYSIGSIVMFFLPLVWPLVMLLWSYTVPISCSGFCVISISYVYNVRLIMKRKIAMEARNGFQKKVQLNGEVTRAKENDEDDDSDYDELI